MSNAYAVSQTGVSKSTLGKDVVLVSGSVNGVFVLINVYKSGLDAAFNAGGSLQIENYLSPLMLAASTAFYRQQGDPNNLTIHDTNSLSAQIPSYPSYFAPDNLTPVPSSWTL